MISDLERLRLGLSRIPDTVDIVYRRLAFGIRKYCEPRRDHCPGNEDRDEMDEVWQRRCRADFPMFGCDVHKGVHTIPLIFPNHFAVFLFSNYTRYDGYEQKWEENMGNRK